MPKNCRCKCRRKKRRRKWLSRGLNRKTSQEKDRFKMKSKERKRNKLRRRTQVVGWLEGRSSSVQWWASLRLLKGNRLHLSSLLKSSHPFEKCNRKWWSNDTKWWNSSIKATCRIICRCNPLIIRGTAKGIVIKSSSSRISWIDFSKTCLSKNRNSSNNLDKCVKKACK